MVKHVTVTTKIHTSKSPVIYNMNYVDHKKPHDSDNGQIKNRVLARDAIYCSTNKKLANQQFKKMQLLTDPDGKRTTQSILEIKSFKNLDYHNQTDVQEAEKLNHAIMKAEHPNSMVYSIGQCDGKGDSNNPRSHGHYIHFHNIISPINIFTGKSTTHTETSWNRAVHITNEVMKKQGHPMTFNVTPIIKHKKDGTKYYKYYGGKQQKSLGGIYAKKHGGYDEYTKAQHALKDTFNHANNIPTARKILVQMYHFGLDPFAHKTENGKEVIRQYKTIGKDPLKAYHLPNGKYARFRKTWLLTDLDTGFKVRTSRLGTEFSSRNLLNTLHTPLQTIQRKAKQANSKQPARVQLSYADDINYNGVVNVGTPPNRYKHYYPRKEAIKKIRKNGGLPAFPEMVPQYKPKPIKPHVSTNQAMDQLIAAFEMSFKTAALAEQRDLAIDQALENYTMRERKKAEEYASYRAGLKYVNEQNSITDQEVRVAQREENEEVYRNNHPIRRPSDGPSFTM